MAVLKFYADWCAPCRALSGKIERLGETADLPVIENVDIDKDMDRAAHYGVRTVPTMIVTADDGTEIRRLANSQVSEKDLLTFLKG